MVAMHGSGENGAQMRIETGYGFDRLADEHGFAVVYPDGYEGYWNGCNIVGDYSANTLNIDDVGFLTRWPTSSSLKSASTPAGVFATGISRGASMAFRLALEAPSHFRAVAAVSENVPTPENFKCKPAGHGTSSVMIMNGTEDPLVPFDGGDVSLFGLFVKRGKVLSSRESGQYFADLNHIAGAPADERDQRRRRCARRARALAQRLQSGSGTGCHSRRWTWHASAISAPSATLGSVAQGAERTGRDLGLLRATAVLS